MAVGAFAGSRDGEELADGALELGRSRCLQESCLHEQRLCMPVKSVGGREVFNFLIHCLLKGNDLM